LDGQLINRHEYRFGPGKEWRIVIANTKAFREAAFRLVYDVYTSKGYALKVRPESAMLCTIQFMHPETIIFLVLKGEEPVGTATVVPDSPLGLAVDLIFPEPLASLRKEGRRLCEVSSLAVTEGVAHESVDLTTHLYRLLILASVRSLKGTDIVACVMAHHGDFYNNVLLFDDVSVETRRSPKTGQQVRYGRLNLETMKGRYARRYEGVTGRQNLYRWFFENEDEPVMLEWMDENRRPMTAEEMQYFGAEKSGILADAGPERVAVLMACHEKFSRGGS
jgi:hypothetical protein